MDIAARNEFLERARALDHNTETALKGEEITTYFLLSDIDKARDLMSVATPSQKALRRSSFFNPPIMARRRLGQGNHDRIECYGVAGGSFSDKDREGLQKHLPLHVKAISVAHKTIPAGETWDVSVRGHHWDLDDQEELYVIVNVGKLTIEPGASMVIRGNVLFLLCQEVVYEGNPGDSYQIGILPTPFSVDFSQGPLNGRDGLPGCKGASGADGREPDVDQTLIGYRLREQSDPSLTHGQRGEDATHGCNGSPARNGGMCKLAEITIRKVTGRVTLFAQAGKGGNGGNGGNGGAGGNGGHGANGINTLSGPIPGGKGGDGGNGGHGGRGGHAGNGGIASNIYLEVSRGDLGKVSCLSLPSQPGLPGEGGHGGPGGKGARPSRGHAPTHHGQAGKPGRKGNSGPPGNRGRSRPAPYIFLNGEVVSGKHPEEKLSPLTISPPAGHLYEQKF